VWDLRGNATSTAGELLSRWRSGERQKVWQILDAIVAEIESNGRGRSLDRSEVLVRILKEDAAALERASAAAPVVGLARGVVRNLERERRRTVRVEARMLRGRSHEDVRASGLAARGWSEIDFDVLTAGQRVALQLRLEGLTEREIGRRIGASRAAVRERISRATRRLRGEPVRKDREDRSWAIDLLLQGEMPRGSLQDAQVREILRSYLDGQSRRQLAAHLGVSTNAIRKRLQRWRRVAEARRRGQM